jgi:hypothetical protein
MAFQFPFITTVIRNPNLTFGAYSYQTALFLTKTTHCRSNDMETMKITLYSQSKLCLTLYLDIFILTLLVLLKIMTAFFSLVFQIIIT